MENIFLPVKSRKSKDRRNYLYSIFTPEVCAKITQQVCTSPIYLEACKWVSGTKRSYCRKRNTRKKL